MKSVTLFDMARAEWTDLSAQASAVRSASFGIPLCIVGTLEFLLDTGYFGSRLGCCERKPQVRPHFFLQFYLSEADVGKHRAQACAKQLAELNPRVKVSVVTALTNEVIAQHQVH